MRFLRTVFGVSAQHPMFRADVMRWKCIAPHPFWEGSRGYALRYKGEIAAFGCVVPCRFLTGSGMVGSCDVIDWAASKAVPGAGVLLYRHIQGLAGTMINIGGSDDARQVLPKIGFKERAERRSYTRVLRPWRQFRTAGEKDWKSPLRLARDLREMGRAGGSSDGLAARRVDDFAELGGDVLPDPAVVGQAVCERTHESLRYFLACPAAQVEAYVLEREDAALGYFLLSRVGHQCRIADLWIRSAEAREWAAAYRAATVVAQADPDTTEVTAAASLPLQTGALAEAGYRVIAREPVFMLDPERRLGERLDVALGFLENDGFYWHGPPA